MTGALDQSKFGAALGRRDEVAGIGVGNLDVLGPVTTMSRRGGSSRWTPVDRSRRRRRATPRRQQVSFVTDHAGDLDCPTEILGTAAPRLQVRGRRERGDAANSLVLGRRRQGQRTTKPKPAIEIFRSPSSTRSRIVFRSARHCVAEKVPVLPPTPRACRSRRSIPTRSPCARPVPARDRPPDDPSHGARQTVHDDQRVTRERPRARRRDSKVQERGTALELLVSEHRARCLGAEPEVRGDRRGRRGTAPNSSRV